MQKNSENFSMQEALRLVESPAGQQLLALLRHSDSTQLQKAADQAAAGDYANARQALAPLLNSPQVQALLKQLGG
jgi:hypothetical protein